MIDGLMPWLAGRAVIVVTNPCTQVARDLIARGVAAFGIGVMNDQLRFELGGAADVRLAGAHNRSSLASAGWATPRRTGSPSRARSTANSPTPRTAPAPRSIPTASWRGPCRPSMRAPGAISFA